MYRKEFLVEWYWKIKREREREREQRRKKVFFLLKKKQDLVRFDGLEKSIVKLCQNIYTHKHTVQTLILGTVIIV